MLFVSASGKKQKYDDDLKPGNSLAASFLMEVGFGKLSIHHGPLIRTSDIDLLSYSPSRKSASVGSFFSECRGMFNNFEDAELKLERHKIEFYRTGNVGKWMLNGTSVGESRMSFGRRRLYWGGNETRMNDGLTFRLTMPVLGPSAKQFSNCVCTVTTSNDCRFPMFLARPDNQSQLMFDSKASAFLESSSEESRAVLIGEYLRVRSLYGCGV